MLKQTDIDFYHDQGYLRIPGVFEPKLRNAMRQDLDWMIRQWATRSGGWSGPWRKQYMDEQTEAKSQLVSMHDLYFYAESWMRGVTHHRLCDAMGQLLGGEPVELHHSTMHVKPSETGHPFPMHQDWMFYPHTDDRYIDVLVHLDDTSHENGEIRFLAGSHRGGTKVDEHVTEVEGEPCTPHLPFEKYALEDTVAVPAKAGDVVAFNINTVHGSYINQTDQMRRMVRVGYRHPENHQISGQSAGRPGFMVRGRRPRVDGRELFSNAGPTEAVSVE